MPYQSINSTVYTLGSVSPAAISDLTWGMSHSQDRVGKDLAVGLGLHLQEGTVAGKKNKLERLFPPPLPEFFVVWTLGRKLMSNCALCWLLFETICCLFSFKAWNVRKRSLFFLFSLTSSFLRDFLPLYCLCPSHTMLWWNESSSKILNS